MTSTEKDNTEVCLERTEEILSRENASLFWYVFQSFIDLSLHGPRCGGAGQRTAYKLGVEYMGKVPTWPTWSVAPLQNGWGVVLGGECVEPLP